jgi:hypothetical protein
MRFGAGIDPAAPLAPAAAEPFAVLAGQLGSAGVRSPQRLDDSVRAEVP